MKDEDIKLCHKFMRDGLSFREAEVTIYVCRGKTTKEIAAILYRTETTVKFHLTKIYKKLGFKSRSQLMAKYICPEIKEDTKDPNALPSGVL